MVLKLSSQVIKYVSSDRDYLITAPVKGLDGTNEIYLSDPNRLSEMFGMALRFLHNNNITDCPAEDKMHQLIRMTKTSSFLQSHLDIIADYIGTASAENAKTEIMAN